MGAALGCCHALRGYKSSPRKIHFFPFESAQSA
jgi:hypothetical protein